MNIQEYINENPLKLTDIKELVEQYIEHFVTTVIVFDKMFSISQKNLVDTYEEFSYNDTTYVLMFKTFSPRSFGDSPKTIFNFFLKDSKLTSEELDVLEKEALKYQQQQKNIRFGQAYMNILCIKHHSIYLNSLPFYDCFYNDNKYYDLKEFLRKENFIF